MSDTNPELAKMQTAAAIEADAAARAEASRKRESLTETILTPNPQQPNTPNPVNMPTSTPLAPIGNEASANADPPRMRAMLKQPLMHTPPDVLAYQGTSITTPSLYDQVKEWVTVTVPKAFTLHGDDGRAVTYEAGVQEMPAANANHWYSRANGVQQYNASTMKVSAAEKQQAIDDANAALEMENARVRAMIAKK